MSRKGKLPIALPKGVEVKLDKGLVKVKGPKGSLELAIPHEIVVEQHPEHLEIKLMDGSEGLSHFHGLYRTLIFNLIQGTTVGYEKKLEMVGVGYRAAVQGHNLDLQIGCSHPTQLPIPQGLTVKVEKNTAISITGIDKQQVGQFAATIRAKKPPEPYQGKGIRYAGEYVRKKAGKAAAKK